MKMLISVLALVGYAHAVVAEIRPAQVFSDHMVLQRDQVVPVWGTARPGASVTVTFGEQQQKTAVGSDGKWRVRLQPMPASDKPRDLRLAEEGGASKVLTDIVVGDVWLGSGQSNMVWTMKHVLDTKDFTAEVLARIKREVAEAGSPLLRFFGTQWTVSSPETVLATSAIGYYFSLEVLRDQKVPVGFIQAAIGGSRIEPWIAKEAFASCELLKDELPAWESQKNPGERIGFCYERVIGKFIGFPIKGILWCQGESNVAKGDKPSHYAAKMELLIKSWRQAWGREDLPFYWVQLCPIAYTRGKAPKLLPAFQDVQRRLLVLPHTGMAMTADVDDGRPGDLHPRNKWDVARRLWRWAAWDAYGKKNIVPSGPLFHRLEVHDGTAVLFFDHTGGGLASRDNQPLRGFEIRGEDGVYHPATATIRGAEVVVSHPEVRYPVAVRYNWHELAPRSLYNKEGLPASPFSTEIRIVDPVLPAQGSG